MLILLSSIMSCQKESTNTESTAASESTERTGQAFIADDGSKPNALQIAIGSKDHTTLVAAVQAAKLENALVNVGPLTVFAPTNDAFKALPEGTVETLLKPENIDKLKDILEYHVTPGNLSVEILTKLKKLGQANNQDVLVEVVDGKPVIGGANIIASVPAGNGIVHVVDKVLVPAEKK
ncbi:MAG: fasciclin domain-containing protein [Bacteroidia bacterium]